MSALLECNSTYIADMKATSHLRCRTRCYCNECDSRALAVEKSPQSVRRNIDESDCTGKRLDEETRPAFAETNHTICARRGAS